MGTTRVPLRPSDRALAVSVAGAAAFTIGLGASVNARGAALDRWLWRASSDLVPRADMSTPRRRMVAAMSHSLDLGRYPWVLAVAALAAVALISATAGALRRVVHAAAPFAALALSAGTSSLLERAIGRRTLGVLLYPSSVAVATSSIAVCAAALTVRRSPAATHALRDRVRAITVAALVVLAGGSDCPRPCYAPAT